MKNEKSRVFDDIVIARDRIYLNSQKFKRSFHIDRKSFERMFCESSETYDYENQDSFREALSIFLAKTKNDTMDQIIQLNISAAFLLNMTKHATGDVLNSMVPVKHIRASGIHNTHFIAAVSA